MSIGIVLLFIGIAFYPAVNADLKFTEGNIVTSILENKKTNDFLLKNDIESLVDFKQNESYPRLICTAIFLTRLHLFTFLSILIIGENFLPIPESFMYPFVALYYWLTEISDNLNCPDFLDLSEEDIRYKNILSKINQSTFDWFLKNKFNNHGKLKESSNQLNKIEITSSDCGCEPDD
ncbi:MAG: hypothetical protein JXA91_02695, partial [Candidatus Thermoplasmatota archaeon]|nr:hypothetical protein [Candidatus Thermoplasmatota archaeon]